MKYFYLFFTIISFSLFAEETPHRAYIKPNSILTAIDGKTSMKTGRGIYANIKSFNSRGDAFIVFDKAGKATYLVSGDAIVEIDKDIALLPNINAETVYPPPSKLTATDQEAFFDTQFNVHFDSMQFNNVYSANTTNSTVGTRFELRTLYSSTLPVNFGLALNYEMASWKTTLAYDNGDLPINIRMHILSFGPHLQHFVYDKDGFAVSLMGGFEYAPLYELSSDDFGSDKYSATLLDLGVELLWGTDHGKWSMGTHYRRHNISLQSSSKTGIETSPRDIAINSLGLMVGYKYEWDL